MKQNDKACDVGGTVNNKKSFAYYFGRAIGMVLALCIAACISGIAIAATIKFFMWLF